MQMGAVQQLWLRNLMTKLWLRKKARNGGMFGLENYKEVLEERFKKILRNFIEEKWTFMKKRSQGSRHLRGVTSVGWFFLYIR